MDFLSLVKQVDSQVLSVLLVKLGIALLTSSGGYIIDGIPQSGEHVLISKDGAVTLEIIRFPSPEASYNVLLTDEQLELVEHLVLLSDGRGEVLNFEPALLTLVCEQLYAEVQKQAYTSTSLIRVLQESLLLLTMSLPLKQLQENDGQLYMSDREVLFSCYSYLQFILKQNSFLKFGFRVVIKDDRNITVTKIDTGEIVLSGYVDWCDLDFDRSEVIVLSSVLTLSQRSRFEFLWEQLKLHLNLV